MVSRQVIRPGQQDDVKPHEHDATDLSGVFGFLRALKAKIDGSVNITGTLRVGAGSDVIIGGADSPGSQLFVESELFHVSLRESDDPNYPRYVFILDIDAERGRLGWFDQDTATYVLAAGFARDGSVVIANNQLRLSHGTAAAPALTKDSAATDGLFFDTAAVGVSVAGSEVARFTTDTAWTAWTPTLTNFTLGNGTVVARYSRIPGGTIVGYLEFVLGSTSAVGTGGTFSLPVTASSSYVTPTHPIGACTFVSGGGTGIGYARLESTTTMRPLFYTADAASVGQGAITATAPATWTTGDRITIDFRYEAA